jgi:hypothetical protein
MLDDSRLEISALEPKVGAPPPVALAFGDMEPAGEGQGEVQAERVFRGVVQRGRNEVVLLLVPAESGPSERWMNGMLPAPSSIRLWTQLEIDGGQALELALPEACQVKLSLRAGDAAPIDAPIAFLRVDRQVDDFHCELQPQAIAFADCRFAFPAGMARFRIEVPGYLPIDDLIDLPAGVHERVFPAVRTAAVALAFLDGERLVDWPATPLLRRPPYKASVADVELQSVDESPQGPGRSVSWLRLPGRLVVTANRPGRYLVHIRAIEGFLPPQAMEVNLPLGETVPLDIPLRRQP